MGRGTGYLMGREGHFHHLPYPISVDTCNTGYHNSIQMLFSPGAWFSRWKRKWGHIWGLGCAVLKGNRKYICFITSLFPTIVWCLLRACVLHDVLQPTKHGGPAAGILLSAIYKPFITLACLLSRLFPYHWWQYILLIVNLNEMQEKTYLKVVLLGKVNSGKTCLVTRYITRSFSEETPSVSKFFSSAIFNFSFNFWFLYV